MFKLLCTWALFALSITNASHFSTRFEDWIHTFDINIQDEDHKQHVFLNWMDNDVHIRETNAKNLTYTLDHNHLSGMNTEEYSLYVHSSGHFNPRTHSLRSVPFNTAVPSSVDWEEKGAVTPVKNQGQCGSCWSFSTTGALEGAYFLEHGSLESFSEQQLVDCDNFKHGGSDHGCNGGLMDNAFNWISKNNGLCSENDYPYVSGTTQAAGTCQTTCDNIRNSQVAKHVDVQPKSDNAMMDALSQQPVSIAIEADQKDFQLYSTGVFTGDCGTNLDHGVLVVGYGSMNGDDFYKVKNSWGVTWGNNGYIYLARGEQYNNGQGQCGILLQGSYPVLE